MKYFKPELLARCRSRDDNVADAAAREWEEALAAYQARFTSIRSQFPGGVRRLCSRFTLHDARVLGVASSSKRKALFGMLLRLEGAPGRPGEILELNYHPVAGPNGGVKIKPPESSQQVARKDVWILYDEFDLDEEHAFFTHSLLLTDGREIEIRFHNLTVRQLDEVATPFELTPGEKKWPLAEVVS
jgi:hypothetical protein